MLQLLPGLQFDICYVIKTRLQFGIAEMSRFLNCIGSYSFALKNVNLKNLENSLEYVYSDVIFYITFKCQIFQQRFLFLTIFSIDLIQFPVNAL